jgi:hypothetical protein
LRRRSASNQVADSHPAVDRLIVVRHNYYSHRNADDVVADVKVGEEHPITRDDVAELLRGGMEIAIRYNAMFHANVYSTQMIGNDDFKHVVAAVQQWLAAKRRDFKEECRRLGVDPNPTLPSAVTKTVEVP